MVQSSGVMCVDSPSGAAGVGYRVVTALLAGLIVTCLTLVLSVESINQCYLCGDETHQQKHACHPPNHLFGLSLCLLLTGCTW
jgi:hypothetical protein